MPRPWSSVLIGGGKSPCSLEEKKTLEGRKDARVVSPPKVLKKPRLTRVSMWSVEDKKMKRRRKKRKEEGRASYLVRLAVFRSRRTELTEGVIRTPVLFPPTRSLHVINNSLYVA